eukprot:2701579-Amphidinium_carterae.1
MVLDVHAGASWRLNPIELISLQRVCEVCDGLLSCSRCPSRLEDAKCLRYSSRKGRVSIGMVSMLQSC